MRIKQFLTFVLRRNKEIGRTTNDMRAFVISNLVAIENSPTKHYYLPSRTLQIKAMGFKNSTGRQLFKDADETSYCAKK